MSSSDVMCKIVRLKYTGLVVEIMVFLGGYNK